jgi:transcriptional regulator with XRE-family HTH domain
VRPGCARLAAPDSGRRRGGRAPPAPYEARAEADILLYITDPSTIIRRSREQQRISQRALALRAGTTQAAISRIERGLTTPTWETVRAILLALGYEAELGARRLTGRWDPVHLAASRDRSPAERLELALSANRLAGRLRQAAAEAERG